jgi:hypothetical protein
MGDRLEASGAEVGMDLVHCCRPALTMWGFRGRLPRAAFQQCRSPVASRFETTDEGGLILGHGCAGQLRKLRMSVQMRSHKADGDSFPVVNDPGVDLAYR